MDSTVFTPERLKELLRDQSSDQFFPMYRPPKLRGTDMPSSIEDNFIKLQHEAI